MALKSETEWTTARRLVGGRAGTTSAVWRWEVYEPKNSFAVANGTVKGAEHKAEQAAQDALLELQVLKRPPGRKHPRDEQEDD